MEFGDEDLEGAQFPVGSAAVGVGGVLGVERVPTLAGGDVEDLVGGDEQDLRVGVDEPADQPGAGDPVGRGAHAGDPLHDMPPDGVLGVDRAAEPHVAVQGRRHAQIAFDLRPPALQERLGGRPQPSALSDTVGRLRGIAAGPLLPRGHQRCPLTCGLLGQQLEFTGERATLVAAWEQWARGDAPQPPDGIAESTRLWAATEPFLEGRGSEIERYLSVAATLHSDVRFGGAINAKHTVWRHVMKWVTRVRPTTDRIACPWLIRRFIDPDAQILFVPADQVLDVAAREGGYSFDAKDATYTHRRTPDGELCTFEVLIAEHHLGDDPALARLARIVHATDVSGQLDTDPLGPGLLAIGQGGLHVEDDDQRLLARGMFVYDALYAWCQHHDQAQAA